MKDLSAFYDYLLPELPGCVTALLDQHLRMVAREWCDHTRMWREDFPPVDSVAQQDSYFLFAPEDADLVAVHKLSVNDTLLYDDTFNDWRWSGRWYAQPNYTSRTAVPRYDRSEPPFRITPDLLQITMLVDEIPECAQTGGIVATGSMKPTMRATKLPDLLLDQYLEDLRAGVLARLLAMAGKPWSAAGQSAMYALQYRSALNLQATNAARGSTRALLRTRPH